VHNGPGHDGNLREKVVNKTTFKDGSAVIEFEGGAMMIVESDLAQASIGAEQAARYDRPAPKAEKGTANGR
jgi:hypothetical protein